MWTLLLLMSMVGYPGYFYSAVVDTYQDKEECEKVRARIEEQLVSIFPPDAGLSAWCVKDA